MKEKEMTDEEVEQFASAIGKALATKEYNKNSNIYQITSIVIGFIGAICSIFIGILLDNIITIIVGLFISIVSALFLYGFGQLIKDVEKIREIIEKSR